jgi:hypothetical protein
MSTVLENQELLCFADFFIMQPLLPNWMENGINAFHNTCTDNKDVCILSWKHLKQKSMLYVTPLPTNNTPPLPEAT